MEYSRRQFSPELKQRIVEELEAGHLSIREAARSVQTSAAMVHHWLEEFGRYRPKRNVVEVVMKSEQERIAALEKALAEAHLTLQVYDELITQANKLYKTDLKKALVRHRSGVRRRAGPPRRRRLCAPRTHPGRVLQAAPSARGAPAPRVPSGSARSGGRGARRAVAGRHAQAAAPSRGGRRARRSRSALHLAPRGERLGETQTPGDVYHVFKTRVRRRTESVEGRGDHGPWPSGRQRHYLPAPRG